MTSPRTTTAVTRRWAACAALATLLSLGACGGGGGDQVGSGTPNPGDPSYPHSSEPIGSVRQIYDGVLPPDMAINTFRNTDRLFPTRRIATRAAAYPLPRAAVPLNDVRFAAGGGTAGLQTYLDGNRVAGLLVLKDGKIANETYRYGNTERTRWMSMSVAKSIVSTLIGAAVKDGHIASIDDPVTRYVPRLVGSAYDGVTVRQVLMMSSGVRWNETYTDPSSDRRQLLEVQIAQKPGAAMDLMARLPRQAAPGSVNNYSTGETQVAGEVLHGAIKKPLGNYLSEKIWSRFGMEAEANWWLLSPDGMEVGGSGINATLRDYGRFGQFILNDGMIGNERIVPEGWIAEATSPKTLGTGAALDYGYLWWMAGGASRADAAFVAIGINGQYIYVNRKERVVIVVLGAQPQPSGGGAVNPTVFFDAVVAALKVQGP